MILIHLKYEISNGLRRGKVVMCIDRKNLIKDMTSNSTKASVLLEIMVLLGVDSGKLKKTGDFNYYQIFF